MCVLVVSLISVIKAFTFVPAGGRDSALPFFLPFFKEKEVLSSPVAEMIRTDASSSSSSSLSSATRELTDIHLNTLSYGRTHSAVRLQMTGRGCVQASLVRKGNATISESWSDVRGANSRGGCVPHFLSCSLSLCLLWPVSDSKDKKQAPNMKAVRWQLGYTSFNISSSLSKLIFILLPMSQHFWY